MSQLKVPVVNRIDSVSNWNQSSYIPHEGEILIGTQGSDTFIKIGDGKQPWAKLNYFGYQKPKVPGTKVITEDTKLDVNDIDLIILTNEGLNITLPSNPYDGKEYTFKTYPEWFGFNVLAPGKKIFYSKKYQYQDKATLGKADSTISIKYCSPLDIWMVTNISKT